MLWLLPDPLPPSLAPYEGDGLHRAGHPRPQGSTCHDHNRCTPDLPRRVDADRSRAAPRVPPRLPRPDGLTACASSAATGTGPGAASPAQDAPSAGGRVTLIHLCPG